jgi:hypothetical protein
MLRRPKHSKNGAVAPKEEEEALFINLLLIYSCCP